MGACAANLLTAFAPTFEVFTGAQLLNRALVNTVLIVAGIAAVEDAPEGARAFATGMYALALGAGFGLSVVLLPLADLGDYGWRISFAVSAASRACSSRSSPATSRRPSATCGWRLAPSAPRRRAQRRRVRELLDTTYGMRFLLLGLAAFLTNVFSAPSSQLTNRYLTHAHDFTNSDVALFRTVTAGLPGIIGVLLASRLAESRGRRPVTIIGLLVATVFQAAFFVAGNDALLWIAPVIAIVAAACAGLALGTLDAELFPTEVRGHVERPAAGRRAWRGRPSAWCWRPSSRTSPVASVPRSRSAGSRRWWRRSSWCPGCPRPPIAVSTTSVRRRCEHNPEQFCPT